MDFTNPRSATVGVELTNIDYIGGDGGAVSESWEQIGPDNPHIKYHSARRGYIACTATPKTLRADFKTIEKVTVRDQPARVDGSLVVEAGRPGAS